MIRRILFIIVCMLPSLSFAVNKKAGTSGAQFLKIGAGARPTAMGDAYVAVTEDVNSVYFNPAGIATISRPEFAAMHTQWIADTNYDFGAFAYPTDFGAFAISAATLKVDEIQRRSNDESYTGDFDAMDSAYALSYAQNLTPLFSLGVTARYIKQSIDTYSATAWAGDVGIIKRLANHPISFGLAARHIGQEIKFKNESDPLPMTVDAGFSAAFFRQKLLLTGDGRWLRDDDAAFGVGMEYRINLGKHNRFALRSGYNSAATDSDGSGITLGGGLGIGRLDLDFAWVPMADLGNTYRYAARIKF